MRKTEVCSERAKGQYSAGFGCDIAMDYYASKVEYWVTICSGVGSRHD